LVAKDKSDHHATTGVWFDTTGYWLAVTKGIWSVKSNFSAVKDWTRLEGSMFKALPWPKEIPPELDYTCML